jgi:hypothetical protein
MNVSSAQNVSGNTFQLFFNGSAVSEVYTVA